MYIFNTTGTHEALISKLHKTKGFFLTISVLAELAETCR
jgi:hypothetical protein